MHATESPVQTPTTRLPRPVIVGHRGAPSYRPEHTTGSYELAIEQGADLIEPDVVVSKDGVLVARHENELSHSTDIATRPEFAHLRTTKQVGEKVVTGWFAEDLTLAELRTLRAVERLPQLRPLNGSYDGRWGILTFGEVVEIARRSSTGSRTVRVLAELKEPSWSASIGLPMAELVADELRHLGAATADGTVVVQSFDRPALRALRADLGEDGPEVFQLVGNAERYDATVTPSGLREVSTYAQGIAPSRDRILLRDDGQALTGISDLVAQAHSAGLRVVPWTLRAENAFLPRHLRRGSDVRACGDLQGEARMLFALGVDGLITDSPDLAVRARDDMAELTAAPAVPEQERWAA
jgi:glycerophosphoryl diester phosphodiesterase